MIALVLEKSRELALREIDMPTEMGPDDVRIAVHTVGICGSDVHYYEHGAIGPFVVREPMVMGHEASGTIVECGSAVKHLQVGDRVCMEPGIPDPNSKASRLGKYNLDPAVPRRFQRPFALSGMLQAYVKGVGVCYNYVRAIHHWRGVGFARKLSTLSVRRHHVAYEKPDDLTPAIYHCIDDGVQPDFSRDFFGVQPQFIL